MITDLERLIKLNYKGMIHTFNAVSCIACDRVHFSIVSNKLAARATFLHAGWVQNGIAWYCPLHKEQAKKDAQNAIKTQGERGDV